MGLLLCCKFKSLYDNFGWGIIGVYGTNDDNLCTIFLELKTFMSIWDIPWQLGGDFNVIRFPSKRSTERRFTIAMREFSSINSSNLIDPPLECGFYVV